MRILLLLLSFLLLIPCLGVIFYAPPARAELCNASERFCGYWTGPSHSRSGSGAPTRGSEVRLNPAAVPLEKSLGVEAIYYDNSVDLALVKGLGRVGAALSPSNSEETFFGPPGIELPADLLDRKQHQRKFPAQKLTLATALASRSRSSREAS